MLLDSELSEIDIASDSDDIRLKGVYAGGGVGTPVLYLSTSPVSILRTGRTNGAGPRSRRRWGLGGDEGSGDGASPLIRFDRRSDSSCWSSSLTLFLFWPVASPSPLFFVFGPSAAAGAAALLTRLVLRRSAMLGKYSLSPLEALRFGILVIECS